MLKDVPAVESPAGPDPQTAEIFSQDQLEAYSERIAVTHRLAENPRRGRPLLPRLDESAARLDEAYQFLSAVARTRSAAGRVGGLAPRQLSRRPGPGPRDPPGPAAQVLPRAAEARRRCRSRATRASTCSRASSSPTPPAGSTSKRWSISSTAYQRSAPLSIGETWAIPIMLRLGARRRAAPPGRRRRRRAPQPREGAAVGRRTGDGARLDRRRTIRRLLRGGTAGRRPAVGGVRRRAAAVAARPAVVGGAGLAGAAARARGAGRLARGAAAASSISAKPPTSSPSATSSRACGAVVDRLAAVLRARQRRRADAARRSRPARTREMDFADARSLPALGRAAVASARGESETVVAAARDRAGARRAGATIPPAIAAITSATT